MFENYRDIKDYIRRIEVWIFIIFLGVIFSLLYNTFISKKDIITLDVPADMKDSFDFALVYSDELSFFEKKIVIDNNTNIASIVIDYGKESDKSYQPIAYSPFVIAYNDDQTKYDEMKLTKLLVESQVESEYVDPVYDFDLEYFLHEIIRNSNWENIGISGVDEFKVYYPAENSIYWHDFYNFLLVNINDGVYPTTSTELSYCEKIIDEFLESPNTIPVSDLEVQLSSSGFAKNSLYVFPEKLICELNYNSRIFYSKYVTMFNYYAKAMDEEGMELLDNLDISYHFYRNKCNSNNIRSSDTIKGIRNSFNLIILNED